MVSMPIERVRRAGRWRAEMSGVSGVVSEERVRVVRRGRRMIGWGVVGVSLVVGISGGGAGGGGVSLR